MKVFTLLLPIFGLVVNSVAERFEKVGGTSGEYSDIVIDSDRRWYIIRDKQLYHSIDNGKTLIKIQLPSKEPVYRGLGIDQFDNIYVQDYKLSVFIVAPSIDSFAFEEITLAFGKEKLVSRPFALNANIVYLTTESGVMELENSALVAKEKELSPHITKKITQLTRHNTSEKYGDGFEEMLYSVKGPMRNWIYATSMNSFTPICQTKGPVKHLSLVNNHIYFTVDGEKDVKTLEYIKGPYFFLEYNKKIKYATTLKGIDALNIDDDSDFTIFSQVNDYKTFIYANIGNSGIVYGIDTFVTDGKNVTQVVSSDKLDNVRILCGVIQDDKIFFGTSDGVYELTNIQPPQKK